MPSTLAASQLAALDAVLSGWLTRQALPVWAKHGHDADRGGFYDSLTQDNYANAADYKRLRVLARQIYVFSEAARSGMSGALDLVKAGVDTLLNHTRHPQGGFASRFTLSGEIIDADRDLYDMAFVIFALAHAYDLLRDEALRWEAEALFVFLEQALAHPNGGFLEGLPARQPRRQNPHMHLLEACLAWAVLEEGGAESRSWVKRAGQLVELGVDRFIDPQSGALTEYFADDWTRLSGEEGRLVEPGHQFEWVWLLAGYEKMTGQSLDVIDGLYRFAWRNGVDPDTGFLHAEVLTDGTSRDTPTRLWTHTEWLKAELAMFERTGETRYAARAVSAATALAEFLKAPTPGLWFERYNRMSGFPTEPTPASSLYHITLAIAETKRVARSALQAS